MKTVITIVMDDTTIYNKFARDTAADLISRGYNVTGVTVAKPDNTSQHWEPKFRPGQHVTVLGDSSVAVVLEVGYTASSDYMRYKIAWQGITPPASMWAREDELADISVGKE